MIKVQKLKSLVNQIGQNLPQNKRRRFQTGVEALSLVRFKSLNTSGRTLNVKPKTGLSRIYRLINDELLAELVAQQLLRSVLSKTRGEVYFNLDHTQIGGFTVAVIGLQTQFGRALPIWSQINQGSRNPAIEPLLKELKGLIEKLSQITLKYNQLISADRFFGNFKLMKFLNQADIGFILRTKTDKNVETPWGKNVIKELANYETEIEYQELRLRDLSCLLKRLSVKLGFC
ncbi:MAG: hypothetical protein OXF49_03485 [Candidatus Saccharibacteria bacterium]|nr:hypothetical protein [Candidatus Saccharibacteria bacterium]